MNQSDARERPPTWRRILTRLAKMVLVIAVIVLVVHGIASFIFGRKLEAEIQAIKAKGEPVSFAQIGGPKVPDWENGAVAYAKAFEVQTRLNPSAKTANPQDLSGRIAMPLDDLLDPKLRRDRPELWDEAGRALGKYSGVFPLVEEAASRPKCRFPVKWEEGWLADLPHLSKMRQLGRLVAAQALLQARNGDMSGAYHSIELEFKMSDSTASEPLLISSLVGISIVRTAADALRQVMTQGHAGEAQARRMYDALGGMDFGPGYLRAMESERALGIWAFDYIRKHPEDLGKLLAGGSQTTTVRGIPREIAFLWKPISYADELVGLKEMNKTVESTRLPYRISHPAYREPHFPWYAVLSRMLSPSFDRTSMRRDDGTAEVSGSRIALALEAYRDRIGGYPTSLSELRAKLGWKIPEDPFSGKDFIYKRRGAGYLLYSIGGNLKDDGGVPFKPRTPRPAPEGYSYRNADGDAVADIVWEIAK